MTTLAYDLERPAILGFGAERSRRATPRHVPTLADLITGTWDDLLSHTTTTCPVCSGAMAPRYGAGSAPVGGRCRDCGSTLG
jgi:hypothetical protein